MKRIWYVPQRVGYESFSLISWLQSKNDDEPLQYRWLQVTPGQPLSQDACRGERMTERRALPIMLARPEAA